MTGGNGPAYRGPSPLEPVRGMKILVGVSIAVLVVALTAYPTGSTADPTSGAESIRGRKTPICKTWSPVHARWASGLSKGWIR